jgi:DNA-directed RNA polymerase specialized sigma24 family protein
VAQESFLSQHARRFSKTSEWSRNRFAQDLRLAVQRWVARQDAIPRPMQEDVVQECLAAIFKELASPKRTGSFVRYVRGIVKKTLLVTLRRLAKLKREQGASDHFLANVESEPLEKSGVSVTVIHAFLCWVRPRLSVIDQQTLDDWLEGLIASEAAKRSETEGERVSEDAIHARRKRLKKKLNHLFDEFGEQFHD